MKLAHEMTFEEKICLALEYLDAFRTDCRETHDDSCCKLDSCFVNFFFAMNFYYTNKKMKKFA